MPFDSAGYVFTEQKPPTPRSLADLGLTPISADRARAWREGVVERFSAYSRSNKERVIKGHARWKRSSRFPPSKFATLFKSAPADVQEIARRIALIPDADVAVISFDKDPILCAYIKDSSNFTDTHCLAIWDKGVVRAIAEGAPLSKTQRFLRRFVRTI